MNPNHIILGLIAFIGVREAVHAYTTQKLINKLMSRNYHEFQMSETVPRRVNDSPAPLLDLSQNEDFNALDGIG